MADTPLAEGWGWAVVIGFGVFFTIFTVGLTHFEQKALGTSMSSEQFNTAGRNVGVGLTAAVIVSQWTWAATLLMSSNMGWRVGISGPFWYASGATVQILLFAVLAIQVKRRASHMHTFMEIVKARFGTIPHCIMICFALMANMIVTAMLLLGGAATISDLTGMSKLWAAFLIPLLSCWIYTMHGGLKATFFASYVHTTVIFLMLIIFTFSVYGGGTDNEFYGSAGKVYDGLQGASAYGFFDATPFDDMNATMGNATAQFAGLDTFIANDGTCFNSNKEDTEKACKFEKLGNDESCCSTTKTFPCRSVSEDCVDVSETGHYKSSDCDYPEERCVPSFLTMGSPSGGLFGITNIVGNFGTVFVDQSYWQSAVAAKPKSAVLGFLVGGLVWFAVPFCMATTNGLVGRAITLDPTADNGPLFIDSTDSGNGLTPARVLSHVLGSGGAFILLLQLFMAITSTGSAEIIAVSSILTYDIYYEYINPELKQRREGLRRIFYDAVAEYASDAGTVPVSSINPLMKKLVTGKFFEKEVPESEVKSLAAAINSFTESSGEKSGSIKTTDLYSAVNRAVSSNSIEGVILLRVSKFFTAVFALFMGFLAVFLQTLGFGLGWVYMSMGVLIGSAVGPASLTILFERASGLGISCGAVGGLILGMFGWILSAFTMEDKVTIDTLGTDWPWVVGNLCAIFGGLLFALVGSLIKPDTEFRWEMLNERIPLVDDIEPPKDSDESDEKLRKQVVIAVTASVLLTIFLLVVWPIPMYLVGGPLSKGGFTFWVVIEVGWALIGGIVIIGLPAVEAWMSFKKLKATKAQGGEEASSGNACLTGNNNEVLKIDVGAQQS